MAHESFEDEATAAYMNEHFVNVKVDREERPDVDAVYMPPTTAMTGHGGWPMTVVLDARRGAVLRRHLLPGPAAGTGSRRSARCSRRSSTRGRTAATRCAGSRTTSPSHLRQQTVPAGDGAARRRRARRRGARRWPATFDAQNGGFGGAPKFPPSMVLEFLLRHAARTGSPRRIRQMADRHAAGDGPRRPLRPARAAASRATRSTAAGWCRTSRRCSTTTPSCSASTPAGGGRPATRSGSGSPARPPTSCSPSCAPPRAASPPRWTPTPRASRAQFYVWTPAELVEVLGPERRRLGGRAARRSPTAGTFEHGASTLQLRRDPDDPSRWARGAGPAARGPRGHASPPGARRQGGGRLERARDRVAGRGGRAARRAAVRRRGASTRPGCWSTCTSTGGSLRRVSRDGVVGPHAGVLEDYACVAAGLPRPAVGDRRPGLAWTGPHPAGRGAVEVRGRRRRLLRHRATTPRSLVVPAARPLRQRQPVGPVGAGARAARPTPR